jgi:hypothetical protein
MDDQAIERTVFLQQTNTAFSLIFAVEALLKIFVLGFKSYFHNSWNQFDFLVALISLFDIVID